MNYVSQRLSSAGIPIKVDVNSLDLKNCKNFQNIGKFIKSNSNLVILGPDSYRYAVKVMSLKVLTCSDKISEFVSMNNIYFRPYKELLNEYCDCDVLAIVGIENTDSEQRKRNLCSFIDTISSTNRQVLLSAPSAQVLKSAVEYSWDVIDNIFDVVHYKE